MITEKRQDFNRLEKEIYSYCCKIGCEMLKNALESWDEELSANRDRKKYRHKGTRRTAIKTVMGTVEYERGVFQQNNENGTKNCVYLLDESMGKSGSGFMSGMLSEMIAKAACESSYRSTSRSVSDLTGQAISHTAAWNVVQELGERMDTVEKQNANIAAAHKGVGRVETPVLFEEQDGIWLNLQGKDRKKHGPNKEMKVAIAYDGASAIGKKRYKLTNKVACAGFESVREFQKRKEGVVAGTYKIDEIEVLLLNGDGASWIRQAQTDETVHFQLDVFHVNKAIRTYVKDAAMRKQITKLLYEKEIDTLLDYIEALSNSVEDESEQQNLLALLSYFTNNKDGLVPCHRRGLNLPEPPEGIEYRRMGAMESNIFTLIGNRMKGRRACWSVKGGGNLARLLCLFFTSKLSETLQNLTNVVLPEKYAEEIEIKMSSKQVALREGKGYNGFKSAFIPSEMKWLKDLVSIKPLHEI